MIICHVLSLTETLLRIKRKACSYDIEEYRNDSKFFDSQVWANSVDPDDTAIWSGSTLFAIPSASFGCMILW